MKTKKILSLAYFVFVLLAIVISLNGCRSFTNTYYWYDADGALLWKETVELGETPSYHKLPEDTEKWDYIEWKYGNNKKEFIAYRIPQHSYFSGNVFQIIIQNLDGQPIATGSAFVFNSDGWFITNAHVMQDAYYAQAIFNIPNNEVGESFTYLNINSGTYYHLDKDIYIGKIEGYDKIDRYYKDFIVNTDYKIGEKTYSIGYPNSSAELNINEGRVTETWSNIYDKLYSGNSYICSSSYIAPGSSGGILTNHNLDIIGITTLGWTDDNDNFLVGASISAFNFINIMENTDTENTISLLDRFHGNKKTYISLFKEMKSDEAEGNAKKVTLDDGTIAYIQEETTEGVNDDNQNYILSTSLLVSTDGWISYETEAYWEGGDRRNITFYGYYDHLKGFANFKYDFKYTWSDSKYYTIKCDKINYSPNVSLTLNQCFVYGHSNNYTPSDENINYAKEQFNYVYEEMLELMEMHSSDHYPHEYGEWIITKEANCVEDGMREKVCSCGEKEIEVLPALGHTFSDWTQTKAPDCTEDGVKERICHCGEKETEVIPALGHAFGDWIQIKAPSCTEAGIEQRLCESCDFYETKDIDASGHNESDYVTDIESTIYAEGKAHTYCTVCSKIICKDITIPKIVSSGFTIERNYTNKTCTITDIGSCQDSNIGIPTIIDGYKVIAIARGAFDYCKNIKTVVIPDGVTSIGESSFYLCENLTSIVIPDSVTSIGNSAFYMCKSLASIEVPNSVTSLGHSVFYGCNSLTSVVISNKITEIKHSTFYDCSLLTSVVIPDGVTIIDSRSFYNCIALALVSLPNSVTGIGHEAFYGCISLASVTIPDGVLAIGVRAFRGCESLTTIKIPTSVRSIDTGAFMCCTNLTSVEIPHNFWHGIDIGMSAFASCSNLTSVLIGGSVTNIGDNAFGNCTSLISITHNSSIESWKKTSKGTDWNRNTGSYIIYCEDGTITKDGTVTYY